MWHVVSVMSVQTAVVGETHRTRHHAPTGMVALPVADDGRAYDSIVLATFALPRRPGPAGVPPMLPLLMMSPCWRSDAPGGQHHSVPLLTFMARPLALSSPAFQGVSCVPQVVWVAVITRVRLAPGGTMTAARFQ